jgi:hypothetical protein
VFGALLPCCFMSFCMRFQSLTFHLQAGSTTVCLGALPRTAEGGGVRGSIHATKLALNAVIPVPSSKVLT